MGNLEKFAEKMTEMIGQPITVDHIHPMAAGRFYYTQAPEEGAPMLLHHYRDVFFIDMHPSDYAGLKDGIYNPENYIKTANWLIGYYWGGGSMIKGGYYQPLDIVKNQGNVRRYLQILSCRGHFLSSGYMPSEKKCQECSVADCPFSVLSKEKNWENEPIKEEDPRIDFFRVLQNQFENQFVGYTLRGFLAYEGPKNEILLSANGRYREEEKFSFTAYASEELIRDLLMRRNVSEVAGNLFLKIPQENGPAADATDTVIKEAFRYKDYVEASKDCSAGQHRRPRPEEKKKFRISNFFKRISN